MSVVWDDYEPYRPLHPGLHADMTRKQAMEQFEHVMNARAERKRQLERLLNANGLKLATDDGSIQAIDDWFQANVERHASEPGRLRDLWYAVVHDSALFLGDVMIERGPTLRWEISTHGGKKWVGFQKQVIAGFTKSKDPKYYVDLDDRVVMDAWRALRGDKDMLDFFVRTINMELERA